MAYQGVNQRATSGFAIDGSGESYSLGEVYPVTRGGQTFGWSVNSTGNSRDRSTGVDRRVAGTIYTSNATTLDFRMDLASTGVGTIRLAFGDLGGNFGTLHAQLFDGGTLFATITGTTDATHQMLDAQGTAWAADTSGTGTWTPNNVAITHTFTSTNFTVRLGDGTSAGITGLAHASVDLAAAPAAINLVGSNASGGSTVSTGAVTVTPPVAGVVNLAGSNITAGSTISTAVAAISTAVGTVTTEPFKAWGSPAPLVGLSIPHVTVQRMASGVQVLNLLDQVTDGLGRLVLANSAMAAGSWYMVGTWNADGSSRGFKAYLAT